MESLRHVLCLVRTGQGPFMVGSHQYANNVCHSHPCTHQASHYNPYPETKLHSHYKPYPETKLHALRPDGAPHCVPLRASFANTYPLPVHVSNRPPDRAPIPDSHCAPDWPSISTADHFPVEASKPDPVRAPIQDPLCTPDRAPS
eukprot:Hpha_TRINITY_DN15542_c1_g1::TRINITY_DN15542_c1_g1_i17::g.109021::m.109021